MGEGEVSHEPDSVPEQICEAAMEGAFTMAAMLDVPIDNMVVLVNLKPGCTMPDAGTSGFNADEPMTGKMLAVLLLTHLKDLAQKLGLPISMMATPIQNRENN
jgi:hypothetical protein